MTRCDLLKYSVDRHKDNPIIKLVDQPGEYSKRTVPIAIESQNQHCELVYTDNQAALNEFGGWTGWDTVQQDGETSGLGLAEWVVCQFRSGVSEEAKGELTEAVFEREVGVGASVETEEQAEQGEATEAAGVQTVGEWVGGMTGVKQDGYQGDGCEELGHVGDLRYQTNCENAQKHKIGSENLQYVFGPVRNGFGGFKRVGREAEAGFVKRYS